MKKNGFTIIELIVSLTIVSMLSLIIMFSITQYASKGRDANVKGNLAVLIPAGESYYNIENELNGDGYTGFCTSTAVANVYDQLVVPNPINNCSSDPDHPGLCCNVNTPEGDSWAACAQEFADSTKAYCVDSRGVKRQICNSSCTNDFYECPSDNLATCE